MPVFPRPARPTALWADIKAFFRQQERHKIVFAILAVIMPALLVTGFYVDSKQDPPKRQIYYVQSFAPGRTDAEIIKQNIADQKILDAKREAKRLEYQRLADKLGIK